MSPKLDARAVPGAQIRPSAQPSICQRRHQRARAITPLHRPKTEARRQGAFLGHDLQARHDQRLVAEAKSVVVCYDYDLMRSKPVSLELKTAILALDQNARVEV